MKNKLVGFLLCLISISSNAQCTAPNNAFASNIYYYNSEVNWDTVIDVHHYKIRYKEINDPSWQYINNIDSLVNIRIITNLVPLSDYIWQIKAYCDAMPTNNTSGWSIADTFTTTTSDCPNTNALNTTNINYNNALANWDTILGANRYKIRYKILGTSLWSNLGPINHPADSTTIPQLVQNTSYEWQIKTFHDSTVLLGSLWSVSDTFMTVSFVAAPFNPIIINTLSTLECNMPAELYLKITQETNEPDIGTGTISSNGGYFNISTINSGDSVGYANMTTATQIINAELRVGLILSQDYAIINSYDSSNTLIGFFTIENENGGIKVEVLGSPNDGNYYTSGFISEIYFTNLFVTPQNAGPLEFNADINSELGDQIYSSDTVLIWCNTTEVDELEKPKKIIGIYDVLGKEGQIKLNTIQLIKFSDQTIEKRIIIKK